MDIFNCIFIIIMIIGFIIIIASIIKINKYNDAKPISDIDESIKEIKKTIDQADLAIDDLNLLSEQVFKRFDEKQKQLLFLYETIEKKKSQTSGIDIKIDEKLPLDNTYKKQAINKNFESAHPMASKIKELLEQGMSVSDIAKALDMGKGEVELIINLRKDRIWKKNILFLLVWD